MQLTLKDCHAFSKISGDLNPLHCDVEYSRRTPFGAPVVHGIHTLLLGIAQHHAELLPMFQHNKIMKLKVDFRNVVRVDEEFIFDFSLNGSTAEIFCKNPSTSLVTTNIKLIPVRDEVTATDYKGNGSEVIHETIDHADFNLINEQKWANAVSVLGCDSVKLLLNITRLVGMKYPGESALFKGFEINTGNTLSSLPVECTFFDLRFRFYKYTILNIGEFQSYARPEATDYDNINVQCDIPDCLTEAKRIAIFGVSSGLGFGLALSALQQGIDVIGFSRSNKSKGIQRLLMNDRFHHIECDIEGLSNVSPSWGITDTPVFYFCTPSVRLGDRKTLSGKLLDRYAKHYVSIPKIIVEQGRPSLFIQPSSSAVVEKPLDMQEYAKAKTEQEEWVSEYKGDTKMTCTRLPAVATDQNNVTGTIKKISIPDALNMMMAELPPIMAKAN